MSTGEFPGYEFEVPRGPGGPRHPVSHDSLQQLRYPPPSAEPAPRRPPLRTAGRGVLAILRRKNWLVGLAAPIVAAITVGIALVVVAGGGSDGTAPSALAAGFPPARLAGPEFTGTAPAARVVLSAVATSAATEVTAGSANGGPAVWVSGDGGASWSRAAVNGAPELTQRGTGGLSAVVHGAAGWLAVGSTLARGGGALVASSADARTWTVTNGITGQRARGAAASAVATGHGVNVIAGHQSAGFGGTAQAAVWYATGLTGWRSAVITGAAPAGGQLINAVTTTGSGFAAVGASASGPAAWLSGDGRTWREVTLPAPAGAERAALDYVAASGTRVVAAGTQFTAAGESRPFAEVSANGGQTWAVVQLPVPEPGQGAGTTVTALTAAGGGFTAAGTYLAKAGPEVVVWTLPPGPAMTDAAWSAVTPQGTGLSGTTAQNAITALSAQGATLTGVGFTAPLAKSGTPGTQQPTIWQSPVRY